MRQFREAVLDFEAALALLGERPAPVVCRLGLAYGLAGRRQDALKVLSELEQASRKRYVPPLSRAIVHSGLGQMGEAFQLLDRAFEERTPALVLLGNDSTTVALRRDPRWTPVVERLRPLVRLPPGTRDPFS